MRPHGRCLGDVRSGSIIELIDMSSPLTLENRLLLACARTDPDLERVRALVERGPDWQGILRRAERWGLAPLVYGSLRQVAPSGRVPKPVTERLRHLYHRDAIYGVAKRGLLRAALLRFSEASIPVVVLKDTALAALVYPSPTLRPIGSIDLLVHRHDLDGADQLLRGMRDAPRSPAVSIAGSGADPQQAVPYLGPGGFSLVHVRDHISSPGSSADRPAAAARLPIEDFWERARPAQIESVAALVLSPEDLLLHLALDLAMHLSAADGVVGHVRTVCDIGETCRRYRNAIHWSGLITQAHAYDASKVLYYSLRLARELVGASVLSSALAELRASFSQLPLEDRFIAAAARDALLSEDQATGPPPTRYTLGVELLATHRATDGLKVARRLLARSCRVRLRRLITAPGRWRARFTSAANSDPSLGAAPAAAPPSEASRRLGESTPRPAAQGEYSTNTPGELAVTFDQSATDGVGSQLHRIYGLYALSRSLHIKYVHSPLARVGYQGLLPLLTGRIDPDFAAHYNAFFSLPSDDFDLEGCERVRVPYLDEHKVEECRARAAETGRPVLLQAHEPYSYTNRHPAAYLALRAVSPYRGYRATGPVRVCIHLRHGDNSVPGRPDRHDRLLPNDYYLRACGPVLEALRQQGAPFVVRLHTEVPPRPYTLHPGISGLYFRLDEPATISPAEDSLDDFESLPNLEMVINVEPREALDDFGTADVLILSRSDLGYLGGLLNPHGLVISNPFHHPALPDWLVADEHGNLDPGEVATRIAGLLRNRGSHEPPVPVHQSP
jgi:Uncharacterised nucleotidyltransferase